MTNPKSPIDGSRVTNLKLSTDTRCVLLMLNYVILRLNVKIFTNLF